MISKKDERDQLERLETFVEEAGDDGVSFEMIKDRAELAVSDRTLQRRLATLVEGGRIEPVGQTRALRYRKLTGSPRNGDDAGRETNSPEAGTPEASAAKDLAPTFASPELTGGAGFTFEDAVSATFYAALIAQTRSVPGLPDRTLRRVAQQQAANGEPLDDLVIDGIAADSSLARLRLQVKRTLIISDAASNTDFQDIIVKSWQTIKKSEFRVGVDRVGAAVGSVTEASKRALETVCEAARYADDTIEFMARFRTRGSAGPGQRQVVKAIRSILGREDVPDVDTAVFQLLKHFVLLQFDLMHEGAQAPALAMSQLSSSLAPEDVGRAPDLWRRLCLLAREGAGRKAAFGRPALLGMLHGVYRFAASPIFRSDLEKLGVESQLALGEIAAEIDGIHLKRPRLLAEIDGQLSRYRLIQIVGLPGTGKSAILKQLVEAQRGPVVVMKADRLHAGTWPHYAASLGLSSRDPVELFAEVSASGTPILFIDGLDRIEVGHRGIVSDVVQAILNDPSLAAWKIVGTTRSSGIEPLRDWLPAKLLVEGTVATVEVGALDDEEAKDLARQRPTLAPVLFGGKQLEEIARRPFFLSVLARELVHSSGKDLPTSEIDLMEVWWRRGGYSGSDAGLIRRQNTLVDLARAGAADFGRRMSITGFDAEALASLRADGIIRDVRSGHTIAFAHDIFFEWAFAQYLIRLDRDWIEGLQQTGEPPILGRAVELLSQTSFHQDGAWEAGLARLEAAPVRPQWRRAWLLGPFSFARFAQVEAQVLAAVTRPKTNRLRQLMVYFQAEKTRPNPLVLSGQFGDALGSRERIAWMADVLAWPSDFLAWRRLLEWVFTHIGLIPFKLRPDVLALFEVWQNCFADVSNAYSDGILQIADLWLQDIEEKLHPEKLNFDRGEWRHLRDKELQDLESRLRKMILRAGRGNSAIVASYLDQIRRKPRARHSAFEQIVAFAPTLASTHPKDYCALIADELLQELPEDQQKREADEDRRSSSSFPRGGATSEYDWRRLGLEEHTTLFSPASPLREPFHSLLRASPEDALDLIRRLCNHAMLAWRQLHAMNPRRHGTPLPIVLTFPWERSEFWGDRNVYRWFRGILGPPALESALMALEDWAFAEVERGRPYDEVIEQVVSGNACCAVLGIATALALSKLHISPAVVPLISCQHLWHWDLQRMIEDKSGLHANLIAGSILRPDRRLTEATERSNRRPLRGREIRYLVTPAVLSPNKDIAGAVQAAIQSFPQKLPFVLTEEQQDVDSVQKLSRTAEIWAEMGRPETYVAEATGDGKGTLIYHQSPKAQDPDVKAVAERAVAMNSDVALLNWVQTSFAKGKLDEAISVQKAIELAQSLDRDKLFKAAREVGDAEVFRTAAVSGVAAVIIAHAPDLENEQLAWAIDVLDRAARMPAPEGEYGAEYSVNPNHPCRYAARGLGALIRREPTNIRAKEALLRLGGHLVYDVAEEALNVAMDCWSVDANFSWIALDLGLRLAILPSRADGDSRESGARRRRYRESSVAEAREKLAAPVELKTLRPLPPAWVFAPVSPSGDPFFDRRRPEGSVWRDPDEQWNWHFAQRILPHIPLALVLGDPERREAFLSLCDCLILWTIERMVPPWQDKDPKRRDRVSTELIEWNGRLFRWLAKVAGYLEARDVNVHILDPIIGLDDESYLALAAPFCSLYVCIGIYDAPQITAVAIEILSALRDRFLKCQALDSARFSQGDLYDRDAAEMLTDLLLDFDREAPGSTRFANGDWSDVGKVLSLIDPIVRTVGDLPRATSSFLKLCEKAKGHYPSGTFVEQVLAMMSRTDGEPAGWHNSGLPGQIANLIQAFAERDHPLPINLQQQMLRILDRLVDMGDRRAAALQVSELFRHTKVDS